MASRPPSKKTRSALSPRSPKKGLIEDDLHEAPAPTIHGQGAGERRLDLLLDFVAFVAKPMPLSLLLDEAPRRIAEIVGAEVASLYLLEGDGDELVLRGNVGFPLGARGKVRLLVGEGITGMAVECQRPISVIRASQHRAYRAFPELHEERYPVFLAVPILSHHRAVGALVVQRTGSRAFEQRDIELITALTVPISSGVRHAQLLESTRERAQSRRTGGGTRKVTLPGVPVIPGRALGAMCALRRPASTPARKPGSEDPKLLHSAFELVGRALGALVTRAALIDVSEEARFLNTYLLMVTDSRLRERAFELIGEGKSVAHALGMVAREANRAANGIVGDPFLQDRARDIEDLCDALLMLSSPDARAELPSKAVLLGDQLTVFDLLVSARAQPVGIALTDRARGPRTKVLLQLMGVPAILDVSGAFKWAAPGDVVLLDADHGFLVINPSRAEVASVRAERRNLPPPSTAGAVWPPAPFPAPSSSGESGGAPASVRGGQISAIPATLGSNGAQTKTPSGEDGVS